MKTQDAVNYYSSIKKLADSLGIWPQAVYKWGDNVPESVAYKLQVITNGKLKVKDEGIIK
jgi:hypothetical protein